MADDGLLIKQRIESFKQKFNLLNSKLDMYHNYQPWVLFKVRNQYENKTVDVLTIDTYNSIATVKLPSGEQARISNIMLIDFQYDKNGAGKANTSTITFAFNPNDKQEAGGKPLDPMIIDKALVTSSYFMKDDSGAYRAIDTIGKHKCYVRFGYNMGDGKDLTSPEYFGQALSAKSELRDGLIYYTINCYSSITYNTNIGINIPARGEKPDIIDENRKVDGGWKCCDAMWEAIMMYFGTRESGNDSRENNPEFAKLHEGIEVSIQNISDSEDEIEVYIAEGAENETIFQYLDRVAKTVNYDSNHDSADKSKNKTLEWSLSEHDNKLEFTIYTKDPTEEEAQKVDEKYMTNIVYEYPTKTNNMVKSFTPDFKFEEIWKNDVFLGGTGSNEDGSGSFDPKQYFVNSSGGISSYDTASPAEYTSGDKTGRAIQTFASAMQLSYNANMTTLGIPADIPIGTIIKVRPIINGYEYHYAGYYMVLKTTDRIDTNGYTTEYTLFKLSSSRLYKTSNEIYKESEQKSIEAEQQRQKQAKNTGSTSETKQSSRGTLDTTKYQGPVQNPIPSNSMNRNRPVIQSSISNIHLELYQGNKNK